MKKIVLLLGFFSGAFFSFGQTIIQKAQIEIPQALVFHEDQEQQLQIEIEGFTYSVEAIKTFVSTISDIQGIRYFNMIIQPESTVGYCDVRYAVSSKEDFLRMLKELFCKLHPSILSINGTAYQNCNELTLP